MTDITIRADSEKNSQVTPIVNEFLYGWLKENGIVDAREAIVVHHYKDGGFVAISNFGTAKPQHFEQVKEDLVDVHPEHKITSADCVWVSRAWISEEIEKDQDTQ